MLSTRDAARPPFVQQMNWQKKKKLKIGKERSHWVPQLAPVNGNEIQRPIAAQADEDTFSSGDIAHPRHAFYSRGTLQTLI